MLKQKQIDMTTQELKMQYKVQAAIFNRNLKVIKTQLNSKNITDLKNKYNATSDSHLAKILMLRNIQLK